MVRLDNRRSNEGVLSAFQPDCQGNPQKLAAVPIVENLDSEELKRDIHQMFQILISKST